MTLHRVQAGALLGLAVGALALLSGCQDRPNAGMVIDSSALRYAEGDYAADIPLRDAGGNRTTLRRATGMIYVVGFVPPDANRCCDVHATLSGLAERLYREDIGVVQISLPTQDCPLQEHHVATCPVPGANLHRYFDPDRVAWNAFGRPEPGTLVLVDSTGKVDTAAPLHDTDYLVRRARTLAWELEPYEWKPPLEDYLRYGGGPASGRTTRP